MNIDELARATAQGLTGHFGPNIVEDTERALRAEQTRSVGQLPDWFHVSHFIIECATLAIGLLEIYKDKRKLETSLKDAAQPTPKLSAEQRDAVISETANKALNE